jgi:nitroreductase
MIKERRSIRSYLDKPIEKEILKEIIDAARLSPSARNIQPWHFIVITEEETLKRISELVPWGSFVSKSPACIVVCGDKGAKRYVEDCCIASENIMLAAKSFGIGTCYVAALGKPVDEVRDLLGIPENFEIVCFISMGYFGKNPGPHDKKDLNEILHWERF